MPRRSLSALFALLLPLLAIGGCGGESTQNFATCGNGLIDTGETCDDGNLVDTDACTSACRPASCGDGVVQAGVEQCDGFALSGTTCASLGLGGTRPACSAACEIDPSPCGSPFTPTSTALPATPTSTGTATATASPTLPTGAPTFTPTPTPTPTQAPCGDGVLRPGEMCDTCPEDCVVQPCTPTTETVAFAFDLVPPPGQMPTGATVRVGYRSDLVSIPGMGSQMSVLQRIEAPDPAPVPFIRNDANYAVVVVLGRTMPVTELFTITFDRCQDAATPTLSDFGCSIEGCASGGAPIEGCTCTVRTP